MQTVFPPTHDSIFGDTYHGVPNPNVPHVHPYPTRYHGPNYTVPGTANDSYVERPYALPPFVGVGNANAALGRAPLFEYVTGASLLDAAVGGVLGYVASPTKSKDARIMWGAAGALALYVAGMAGLIGFGGVLAYKHNKI